MQLALARTEEEGPESYKLVKVQECWTASRDLAPRFKLKIKKVPKGKTSCGPVLGGRMVGPQCFLSTVGTKYPVNGGVLLFTLPLSISPAYL